MINSKHSFIKKSSFGFDNEDAYLSDDSIGISNKAKSIIFCLIIFENVDIIFGNEEDTSISINLKILTLGDLYNNTG
jgi:hypothetical protein